MRYLIDERNTEPATSLALYRATLAWASTQGDRFLLGLQSDIYDDPDDLAVLRALGQVAPVPPTRAPSTGGQPVTTPVALPADLFRVEGVPGEAFVHELTRKQAPARAIAGDLSPAEIVLIFNSNRILYGLYDYGRTQALDLSSEELESLSCALERAGLDPAYVIAAPNYVRG